MPNSMRTPVPPICIKSPGWNGQFAEEMQALGYALPAEGSHL